MFARSTSTTRSGGTDGRTRRVAFHRRARWREVLAVQAFFLPTVLSFVFLVGVPTVLSVVLSFTNFDGYSFQIPLCGPDQLSRPVFRPPDHGQPLFYDPLRSGHDGNSHHHCYPARGGHQCSLPRAQARQSGLFLHIGAQPVGAGPRVGLHPFATGKRPDQLHVERPLRHRARAMAFRRPPSSVLCDNGGSLGAGWVACGPVPWLPSVNSQ